MLSLERTRAGDIKLNKKTFQAVGEPIVRYVHSVLWEASWPNQTGRYVDFPRVTDKAINRIMRQEGIEHGKKGITVSLSTDVARILQQAGVALYRRPHWYLKPYSSERVGWYSLHDVYSNTDERVEKRIEEEADQPITKRIDLRSIKLPDEWTPEATLDFIERFVPAALRIQDDLDELLDELHNQELKSTWKGIGERLSALLQVND